MGREIILLHFGQAGVQIGSALWELFCIEHRLQPDGRLMSGKDDKDYYIVENLDALYSESRYSWTPRAIMVDLEPNVMDEIRTGCYRHLWRPRCLISGKEDAANNYGRGNYTVGREKLDETMECVRKLAEETNNLAAFEAVHSQAGGTGSGLTSLILTHLCEEYGKKFKFGTSVFPSPTYSQSTVDPYNAILHVHSAIESLDCDILFDNQTIFSRCTKNLDIERPSFTEINRLLAQMLSSVFLSHRFVYHGSQRADTTELLTNLVPYPRIHFQSLSYAPLVHHWQAEHETHSVSELTTAVFGEDAKMLDFPSKDNAYISCAMLYRGIYSPKLVYDALQVVKGSKHIGAKFVDWCPTGFKIGLSPFPPVMFPHAPLAEVPRAICMLAGNLGIRHAWHRLNMKFDVLYSRRSFVHWFVGEGVEESEFTEARDDLAYLEQDYAELMSETIQAVEMVEPPGHQAHLRLFRDREDLTKSPTTNRSNPELSEYPDTDSQSNNANTMKVHEMFTDSRMIKYKPPLAGKFGDTIAQWASPFEHPESVSQPVRSHSLKSTKTSKMKRQPSRFAYEMETVEASPEELRLSEEIQQGDHLTAADKVTMQYDNPTQDHRPHHHGDELHFSELISTYSGNHTSDLSRAAIPRGRNMNNAECSRASTGFLPTNSVVQHMTDEPSTDSRPTISTLTVPLDKDPSKSMDVTVSSVSTQAKASHCRHRHRRCQRKHRPRHLDSSPHDVDSTVFNSPDPPPEIKSIDGLTPSTPDCPSIHDTQVTERSAKDNDSARSHEHTPATSGYTSMTDGPKTIDLECRGPDQDDGNAGVQKSEKTNHHQHKHQHRHHHHHHHRHGKHEHQHESDKKSTKHNNVERTTHHAKSLTGENTSGVRDDVSKSHKKNDLLQTKINSHRASGCELNANPSIAEAAPIQTKRERTKALVC